MLNKTLKDKESPSSAILIKILMYNNGMQRVTWTEEEIDKMNILKELCYAIVGMFSYGWTELKKIHTPSSKTIYDQGRMQY